MTKVLVVDDQPDWLQKIGGWLRERRYDFETAANEAEALARIVGTRFQVALVDVRLHGDEDDGSGLALAMAIRRLDPAVRIIFLTGFPATPQAVATAMRYRGVVDYVEKTTIKEPAYLDAKIRAALAKSLYEEVENTCQFSLSLKIGQPIVVRTRGTYVSAARTSAVLELDLLRYLRRTEIARNSDMRFRFSIQGIGQDLYRDIFLSHPRVRDAYMATHRYDEALHMCFEAPRDLQGVPFELLHSGDAGTYLSLHHPMFRFVTDIAPQREALSPSVLSRLKEELRVLIITSDTGKPIPLIDQTGQEVQELLRKDGSVQVDLLSTTDATCGTVRDRLRRCTYHIVHYIGHGVFDRSSPEQSSLLFWEKPGRSGNVLRMTGAELSLLLQNSEVRLFHLSCCEGTRAGTEADLLDDDYLGIADGIIKAGVPSALGFRWPVAASSVRKLTLDFYAALLAHGSPEWALFEARRELAALDLDNPDWASPILIVQN